MFHWYPRLAIAQPRIGGGAADAHGETRRQAADSFVYTELSSDVQRARTLVPTAVINAMAPTMIRPAMRAYSSTSPPASSANNLCPYVYSFDIFLRPSARIQPGYRSA